MVSVVQKGDALKEARTSRTYAGILKKSKHHGVSPSPTHIDQPPFEPAWMRVLEAVDAEASNNYVVGSRRDHSRYFIGPTLNCSRGCRLLGLRARRQQRSKLSVKRY
jgi:hypothetical protein